MYLDASVGAGQLGELDAAAVVHVPQTHLSENNGRNSKPIKKHLQSHCLHPGFLYGSFLHFDFSTNGSRLGFTLNIFSKSCFSTLLMLYV